MTDDRQDPESKKPPASMPIGDLLPMFGAVSDSFDWESRDAEVARQREQQSIQERDREEKSRRMELGSYGFPQRAIETAKSADETTAAIRRVADWNYDDVSMLVLSGAPGCGKTVAATWWAMRQRRSPRFVRATTFAASSRYDRETRDGWFSARGLVLDDLGTEYLDAKGSSTSTSCSTCSTATASRC